MELTYYVRAGQFAGGFVSFNGLVIHAAPFILKFVKLNTPTTLAIEIIKEKYRGATIELVKERLA